MYFAIFLSCFLKCHIFLACLEKRNRDLLYLNMLKHVFAVPRFSPATICTVLVIVNKPT